LARRQFALGNTAYGIFSAGLDTAPFPRLADARPLDGATPVSRSWVAA
jgi:hypothetical protein